MAKRVLMVATVPSMIGQFNMNNIHMLLDMGYEIDVAGDFTDTSVWPLERVQVFKNEMKELGVKCIQLDFSRSPLKIKRHFSSYKEILRLIRKRRYLFIHTHSPIASAVVRIAAHKTKTKVIYTAHGFHFYKGAPVKNWIIFYPVEKILSRYTNVLITINKEDYSRASRKFMAKKTVYIPGVGVDTQKFNHCDIDKMQKRKELGLCKDDFVIISVGELNDNKNHQVIIKALKKIPDVKYVIVGKGILENDLKELSETIGVSDRVIITGFRTDVKELLWMSDCFAFPSKREGLGIAALEALATGLPVLGHDIGGIRDFCIDGITGYLCKHNTEEEYADLIQKIRRSINNETKQRCIKKAAEFDSAKTDAIMRKVYKQI